MQFVRGFTGTITHSWLTNQSVRIDLVIIQNVIYYLNLLTPLFSGSGRLPWGLGGIFSLRRAKETYVNVSFSTLLIFNFDNQIQL